MADQRGSERSAAVAASSNATTSTPGNSPTTGAPPARKAPDELLCTICGLKACWTKPEDAASAQDRPAPSAP